tara:strand:+ start:580 stop:900 length:321 start_codon:yes stop_codon:yes gene_type:complete
MSNKNLKVKKKKNDVEYSERSGPRNYALDVKFNTPGGKKFQEQYTMQKLAPGPFKRKLKKQKQKVLKNRHPENKSKVTDKEIMKSGGITKHIGYTLNPVGYRVVSK